MIESLKTTKNLRDVVKSSTTKNSCQSQINVKRQIVQFTRRTRITYSIRGNEFHTLKTLSFSICATWCLKAKSFLDCTKRIITQKSLKMFYFHFLMRIFSRRRCALRLAIFRAQIKFVKITQTKAGIQTLQMASLATLQLCNLLMAIYLDYTSNDQLVNFWK